MLEGVCTAWLTTLSIQRCAPEVRRKFSVFFAVQISLVPCQSVKRSGMIGLCNAEAMRQLTHRSLVLCSVAFGHEGELQYAPRGFYQQMWARMHFTDRSITIGISWHAIHGGGVSGFCGRIDVCWIFHTDLISHSLKITTLHIYCPGPSTRCVAMGQSSDASCSGIWPVPALQVDPVPALSELFQLR